MEDIIKKDIEKEGNEQNEQEVLQQDLLLELNECY